MTKERDDSEYRSYCKDKLIVSESSDEPYEEDSEYKSTEKDKIRKNGSATLIIK